MAAMIDVEQVTSEVIVEGAAAAGPPPPARPPRLSAGEERFRLRELMQKVRRDALRTSTEGIDGAVGDHE